MDTAGNPLMTDSGPRGLMTDREREILLEEADVTDKYRSVVITRVRNRIQRLGNHELEALEYHDTLADELREIVCPPPDGQEPGHTDTYTIEDE